MKTLMHMLLQFPLGVVLLLLLAVLTIGFIAWLVLRAFREGREIWFWPPKLGAPQSATKSVGTPDVLENDLKNEGQKISVVPLSEQSSRNRENLAKRLQQMNSSDTIKFISITSRWLFEPQTFLSSTRAPIAACLEKGATIRGVLLDPICDAAKLRCEIESPGKPWEEAMLTNHSESVRSQVAALREKFGELLEVRKFGQWITFQLWLLPDVAILEPYHIGQTISDGDENPLCGFTHIHVPECTKEYQILNNHFETIWRRAAPFAAG